MTVVDHIAANKTKYLIALLTLLVLYVFRFEYVPVDNGVIYRINRYTHQAYWTNPRREVWVEIKEEQPKVREFTGTLDKPAGRYDDLLAEIPPANETNHGPWEKYQTETNRPLKFVPAEE